MTRLVLDASAGVELLLNTTRAHSLSAQFPSSAEWWVPEHYFVEVAGALRRAVLNGDATLERVEQAFSMWNGLCSAEPRSGRCCPMPGPDVLRSRLPMRSTSSSLNTSAGRS